MTIDVQLVRDWATILRNSSQRTLETATDIETLRYEQGYSSAFRKLEKFLDDPVAATVGLREPQGSLEGSRE